MLYRNVEHILIRIGTLFMVLLLGTNLAFGQENENSEMSKVNGVSLVSINGEIDSSNVSPVVAIGANWAAAIPFAYMPSHTKPELSFDLKWQWRGERIEGTRNYIRELHAQNISVMVKPQIWIGHGTYTGKIKMDSNKDWEELEVNYKEYILAFAKVAEEEGAEMFCIGTELKHFAEDRSSYWVDLIKEIRNTYTGKLTYAANWDDYDKVPFWSDVDFIGIDAYFPIADKENASLEKLEAGWMSHKGKMDALSENLERPILFTEYGYRSVPNCAVRPWDYSEDNAVSEKAQQLALKALYNVFWKDNNYVGGFLWKWYPNHRKAGGSKDKMFTVQNKKAEKTVREIYSM